MDQSIRSLSNPAGFSLSGHSYHCFDHVLIQSESGPLAEIGQIVGGLDFGPAAKSLSADSLFTVQVIGRMSLAIPLLPDVPAGVVRDEVSDYLLCFACFHILIFGYRKRSISPRRKRR